MIHILIFVEVKYSLICKFLLNVAIGEEDNDVAITEVLFTDTSIKDYLFTSVGVYICYFFIGSVTGTMDFCPRFTG